MTLPRALDQGAVLGFGEGWRLAGGARDDHAGDASAGLALDLLVQAVEVDGSAVGGEGRDEGGDGAREAIVSEVVHGVCPRCACTRLALGGCGAA